MMPVCRLPLCLGLAALVLAGCADVPELDATVPRHLDKADYPALVPIETLLVPLPPPLEQAETLQSELESRRDSLQRRAQQLNATVVDDETQARMNAGVTQ